MGDKEGKYKEGPDPCFAYIGYGGFIPWPAFCARYCWQRINQLRAELYEEERICLRKSEKKQEDYRRQGKARKNIGA